MTTPPLSVPVDLDAVEARCAAATPGPWRKGVEPAEVWADRDAASFDAFMIASTLTRLNPDGTSRNLADADFIAHSRTDVPALVARVRELQAALGRVEAVRERWASDGMPVDFDAVLFDLQDALDGVTS